METSLRFDSRTKHLCLFAKEKFSNDDNYVLTVRVPRAPSGPKRPNPNPRAREAAVGRGFSIRRHLPRDERGRPKSFIEAFLLRRETNA